jgi:putative flippase GtrA
MREALAAAWTQGSVADRLLRYGLTGGTAAVVDLGGFLLIAKHVSPVFLAAGLSFAAAAAVNYALSALFAFRAPPNWRRFGLFFAFAVLGLGVNAGVTAFAAAAGVGLAFAKLTGIGVAFGFNFAVNHIIVFPRRA